jgi:voltage-gated sodium channel
MIAWCRKIAEDRRFQGFIMTLIVLNAIMLGVETDRSARQHYAPWMDTLEAAILTVFVAEIVIRMLAHAPHVLTFFKDPWNVFDFGVVAVALLPSVGAMAIVVRLARILRVVRLLGFSQQLRLIVDTLLRSIPSMAHVVMLLGILIYTYSILGITLFRDPEVSELPRIEEAVAKAPPGSDERAHLEETRDKLKANAQRWGNLGTAAWSMFQTLTFENWVGLQDPLMEKHWYTPLFFGSFILLGVFIAMNLFVAVVMNNLEEVKAEQRAEPHGHDTFTQLLDQLAKMKEELTEFEATLQGLRDTMAAEGRLPTPPSS